MAVAGAIREKAVAGGWPPDDGPGGDVPCEQQLISGQECEDGCDQSEPPFEPCEIGPGGGDDPYTPPCDRLDPPDYCQPEPCDTGNLVLDDSSFQQLMIEASIESGFDKSEDNRLESSYVIRKEGDNYTKELIPYSERTACSFDISAPTSFFNGAVALLHTHPYAPGETVTNMACLESKNWDVEEENGYPVYGLFGGGPSQADVNTANFLSLDLYTIDAENIYITDKNDILTGQAETITRCGY